MYAHAYSESPANRRGVGEAFFLAGPSSDAEVQAPWIFFGDLGLPAEFEESARAFQAGGRGAVVAVPCFGFACEFVVPGDACVVGFAFIFILCPAKAESGAEGVYAVQFICGIAKVILDQDGIAAQAGPVQFAIEVVFVRIADVCLSKAEVRCDVVGVGVVPDVIAGNGAVEIAVEVTGADHAFVMEAVVFIPADEDAAADIALVSVGAGVFIVDGVVSIPVFKERHDGIDIILMI